MEWTIVDNGDYEEEEDLVDVEYSCRIVFFRKENVSIEA